MGDPFNFCFDHPPDFDVIVTRAPPSRKFEFMERAFFLGKPFLMLLPFDVLIRKRSVALLASHGNIRVAYISPAPRFMKCAPDGSDYGASLISMECIWLLGNIASTSDASDSEAASHAFANGVASSSFVFDSRAFLRSVLATSSDA